MNTQLSITDYSNIAKAILANRPTESEGYEVTYNGLLIMVSYEAEYKDVQGGDNYNGIWEMCSELVSETIEITEVWDCEGNEHPKIAETLQLLLNN